ncbi:hypothetical protein EPUL_005344, partial [Erysiphe pulchra]
MSGPISTIRCSRCNRNRDSSLFTHLSRATPYKTCFDCRSRRRGQRRPFAQLQRPLNADTTDNENNPESETVNISHDIGAFEIEEPMQAMNLIGEECAQNDDPIIISSQRQTPEFQSHLEAQRLLRLEGNFEGQPDQYDENEIDGPFEPWHEVSRRQPPWLSLRGYNRALPAGYHSQYNRNMPTHDLGDRISICPFCKALHWVQERVHSSSMRNPRFQTCCKEGQVVIDPIPEPPEYLRRLWTSEEEFAKRFRRQARQYNNAFAFTSFNYSPDRRLEESGIRGGIQSFAVHGEIFHRIGAVPRPGVTPAYAQLYFLSPEEANEHRVRRSNLDPAIIEELSHMINLINPFVSYYHTALQSLQVSHAQNVQNQSELGQRAILNPQYRLIMEQGADRRRYNLPTAQEFAILIPDEVDSDSRDVILFLRNSDGTLSDQFQFIHRGHPAYLPLHYVLFYPYGNPGYRWEMRLRTPMQRVHGNQEGEEDATEGTASGRISARLFYRYHLFSRQDSLTSPIQFNPLIHGERLFQQICCDMYACVDDSVLTWHRFNQDTIRSDLYSGVVDALRADEISDLGEPVILSHTYHGGDRHMARCYQNAMAITRVLGNPTVFLTFTANPHWPEIRRNLEHSQTPDARPDLIAI